MKLAPVTSTITLTLLSSFFCCYFFFDHAAAAASPSPQSINLEKPDGEDDYSSRNNNNNNQAIKLTTYPAGHPKQVYNFRLTRGLAIESLNLMSDLLVATLDEAPENTVCLFWRLDQKDQPFLDRSNVLQTSSVSMSEIRRAYMVMCFDKTRPEFAIGYRDNQDIDEEEIPRIKRV